MDSVTGENKLPISSQGKKKNKICQSILRLIGGEHWLPWPSPCLDVKSQSSFCHCSSLPYGSRKSLTPFGGCSHPGDGRTLAHWLLGSRTSCLNGVDGGFAFLYPLPQAGFSSPPEAHQGCQRTLYPATFDTVMCRIVDINGFMCKMWMESIVIPI